jgi:pyruvate/2-oxoglutarate dehydrogenase complex dihydrolipoamide dehydrogenase (E3) component
VIDQLKRKRAPTEFIRMKKLDTKKTKRNKILGLHIASPHAGEILQV